MNAISSEPCHLSVTAAAQAIADGKLTSQRLIESCLERIAAREDAVGAWAHIEPALAIEHARHADRRPPRTPLHGIPIGVKDIIDTAGMPTEYGSAIYRGHVPSHDAACVALYREAGGIVMGKTVTTEFAMHHAGKTRNPRNPAYTPGGSSSGSGAAVADYMVPLAFGTQTTSSVIRPASYCGVVGYKPSFNLLSRMGIKLITESFDTLGVLGRTVPDVSLVARVLADSDAVDFDRSRDLRPRIGFCRSPYWDSVSAPLQQAMAGAASKLSAAGAVVVDLDLQPEFANLVQVHADIYGYEIFRALAYERTQRAELIAPEEALAIHAGGRVNRSVYECAQAAAANCRRMLDAHFDSVDVLISASATGEAPRDLKTTGRPIMGMMWTALHTPSISLPVFDGPAGMPMGLQVIGRRGNDAQALLCAEWIHQILT